jgi:hypothetical protein
MTDDAQPPADQPPPDQAPATDAEMAARMRHLERTIPAMDLGDAERLLTEVKQIFDGLGLVFFLRQGTCLGAYRDHALIAWDDDLDLGSIIDMHGFTVDDIDPAVEALRANGCYVEVEHEGLYTSVRIFKYDIRIDWQCYRVVEGTIAHYPGVPFPIRLFTELAEVDFIGGTYLIPSPPEEYLTFKYGPDWSTPKQIGYEKDVLDNMPPGAVPGRAGWLKQFLFVYLFHGRTARLLVLDGDDQPVAKAEVLVAGFGTVRTNGKGIARFYLPGADLYALAVTANGREEVLYEEALEPGGMYVYRPDPAKPAGRYFALTDE